MGLKEQFMADVDSVFMADFGEPAEYNGKAIKVIPEIGEGELKGHFWENERRQKRAIFFIKTADVPDPQVGDVLVHAGVEWNYAFIVETDGVMTTIECTGAESAVLLGR